MSHITLALINTKTCEISMNDAHEITHQIKLDLDDHDAGSFYDAYDEWLDNINTHRDSLLDALEDAHWQIREAEQADDKDALKAAVTRHSDILAELTQYNGLDTHKPYVLTYDHDDDDTRIERHLKRVFLLDHNGINHPQYVFNEDGYYEEQQIREDSELSQDALDAALTLGIPLEHAYDAYQGNHDSWADFAQQWHDDIGTELGQLANHIDWDSVANDMRQGGDFAEHDGHFFDPSAY